MFPFPPSLRGPRSKPLRLLKRLFLPVTIIVATISWLIQRRAARRMLKEHGWAEVWLEGEIVEIRPQEDFRSTIARRILRRRESPRVVLFRLRAFAEEIVSDPYAKGIVVRLGPLSGGWSGADAIREALVRIRDAGREVIVFIPRHAQNREWLVATAGTEVWMTPSGGLAAAGSAATGLFLKRPLEKLGVRIEVASRGRFKSAPERVTREERSDSDREQTQAVVDALDEVLLSATAESRSISKKEAEGLIDGAPYVGEHAHRLGHIDRIVRDEDLLEELQLHANLEKAPRLVGAARYLSARRVPKPWPKRKKRVGVVEVRGTILDERPPFSNPGGSMAVEKDVVRDLRAAREDKAIDAVVLYIDSPGGSVTASDTIWAAIKRVNREKPVVACMSDVAASGGYYVACAAQAMVASPLTITGSIGVYAMLPTWPDLAQRIGVGRDALRNRLHANLYDPWRGLDEEARSHADEEVGCVYEQFLRVVSEARELSRDDTHELAQGRVWTGRDAHERGLVDGVGGMPEALMRAKELAGGRFEDDPVVIHARRDHPRPLPFVPEAAGLPPSLSGLMSAAPRAISETAMLWLTTQGPMRLVAYVPLDFS